MDNTPSILFVCLGNICRSPMAQAVCAHLAAKRGISIMLDSCGIGSWHAGDNAHAQTLSTLARHGVSIKHVARQVRPALDFVEFDLLLAMDEQNKHDLLALEAPEAKVKLLRSFDARSLAAGDLEVPDPYGRSDDAFEQVYAMVVDACGGLLDRIAKGKRP